MASQQKVSQAHALKASSRPAGAGSKIIRLMRHGTTEMNEYLRQRPYGSPNFKDPGYYDTRLTESGKEGAKRAEAVAKSLEPQPDLLVISPLTRALQTASLAFLPWYSGRVIVEPLARERVWLSSDTGRSPDLLAQDFKDYPQLSFEGLPDVWWYTGGLEPEEAFQERVKEFKEWLLQRPETCIAIVAHWGLIYELTGGVDFANCELRSYLLTSSKCEPLDQEMTLKQRAGQNRNLQEGVLLAAGILIVALMYAWLFS
uniref:Phosphoglycerate mutase-like protein n=1 Tax=Dunaliella tertiolecta TaxID=3047 RepID=A0A7S3VI36_DUNTE|mmetsp:Transcript_27797/g.75183  ORF Transcript_27797/g.75183 Transcript_27797/m.75183 type:complete len:258 (-) Transcript_27797:439-1212(-)